MLHNEDRTDLPGDAPVPYFRRAVFYLPLIIIGGIAMSILVYVLALRQLGWEDRSASKTSSLVSAFSTPGTPEVALYRSPASSAYLQGVGGDYAPIIAQWRRFLHDSKRPFREIADAAALSDLGPIVLIVPTAIALSEAERAAIVQHQRRGGSVLASGPIGARDDKGAWQGWQFAQKLFALQVTEEVPASAPDRYLITIGQTPITLGLPAGTRVWLGSSTESAMRFTGGHAGARLGNWGRDPGGKGASLAYGDVAGARWVLFGFTENSWDAQPVQMSLLAANALDWLQGRPQAQLADWPANYRAAQVVAMDVEEDADNALTLASMLDAVQVHGSFYVLGGVAAQANATLATLARSHEIAFRGDRAEGFKGQSASEQRQRLLGMKKQLLSAFPPAEKATGFRAPAESYDEATEEILLSLGLRYHLADPSRVNHRLPLLSEVKAPAATSPLVVLPRTQRDDFSLLSAPANSAHDIATALKTDLDAVVDQGAMGVLSLSSRNFAKDSAMQQAMATMLIALAQQRRNLWLATGSELAQWWQQRSQLRTQLTTVGTRKELELSNVGAQPVRNATVIVTHPRASSFILKPTKAWIPQATVFRLDAYRSAVVFDEIKPGNYAYQALFE
jgi:peptidoglycan/xylan/chitin deacetylase (PgdA/CDA1 family)